MIDNRPAAPIEATERIEPSIIPATRAKRRRPCNRPRVNPGRSDRNRHRPESIRVRLSPAEFRRIDRAAKLHKMTPACFMRSLALLRMQQILDRAGVCLDQRDGGPPDSTFKG
jgi:hypothetical protein